jgi:hypothetical protein
MNKIKKKKITRGAQIVVIANQLFYINHDI